MALNHERLAESVVKAFETGGSDAAKAVAYVREAFQDKAVRNDFSLGGLFAGCFGMEEFHACQMHRKTRSANRVMEAAGAVRTAAFQNITDQFLYTTFLEGYEYPEFVFQKLIPSRPSPFRAEKVPGVTNIGDEAMVVDEEKEYPSAGVAEDWRFTPDTKKRGVVVNVTWEAIFFDRSQGQLREKVSQNGKVMGLNREKRAIDCVIDAGETINMQYRYRWKDLGPIATYGDNSGSHSWDNRAASNALGDYTNIQAAWTLLMAMTDPSTGEPFMITPKHLVIPHTLVWNTPFVLGGQVSRVTPGYATTGNPLKIEIPNPVTGVVGTLQQYSSQLLTARQAAASKTAGTWYMGDIAEAFEYVENLPLETSTAPAGNELEFSNDIVMRMKAREMGTYATKQPRVMIENVPA